MTTRPPLLDPDDPRCSAAVEAALSSALDPVQPDLPVGAAMRQRLLDRARASRAEAGRFNCVRQGEGGWRPLADGVRVKLLNDRPLARSVLVELDAGAALPAHRHHRHEECVVLRGSALLGDLVVRRGDYHVAPAGSRHGRVSSQEGALLYLRGVPSADTIEVARDLVTAWLPGKGAALITVRADEGRWEAFLPGVQTKHLWNDGTSESLLVRMQPGARLPAHVNALDEECVLVEGEMFVGDTLLRAGDFQLAPCSAGLREVASDVGALFYINAAADWRPQPPA